MRKLLVIIALLLPLFAFADTNVQVTSSGSSSGNCTGGAVTILTPAQFNANTGSHIAAGTNVLLCGTFTGTSGQALLTIPVTGTSGNPVTINFDSGAILSAPYWGSSSTGAINCSGRQYITINGQGVGVIQNTANGTVLTYQQSSYGIYFTSCINSVVKNLTIQNIYANGGSSSSATDVGGANTADVAFFGNSTNDIVSGNTLNNARTGVYNSFDNGYDASGFSVYNNTIADHGWHITVGACNASSTATGITIYNNDVSGWMNWQYPSSTYHTDGIIVYNDADGGYTCSGLGAIDTFSIFNNYFHGSLGGGSPTGYVACGERTACTIFNNLMVDNGSLPCDGYIWAYATGGPFYIYNNTIVGQSASQAIALNASLGTSVHSQSTIENNIFTGMTYAIGDYNTSTLSGDITASNNNVWNVSNGTPFTYNYGGSPAFISYTTWKGYGFDAASTQTNPGLTGAYLIPSTSSSAYHLGSNLTSLSIPALDVDKAGTARPSSGAWDAGAYQYSSGATTYLTIQGVTIQGATIQ